MQKPLGPKPGSGEVLINQYISESHSHLSEAKEPFIYFYLVNEKDFLLS